MTPPAPDPADLRRSTAEDVAAAWVGRDRAVVWHGFTQMAAYPALSPVIVERAENRDLIDVAGQRFLDGISSLWVTTLGHRTAELDAAVRRQLDRVAHSTLLGNGSRVVVELAEALAAVVPVDGPHVLFASDGASAVEQALKVVFQHHVNRGEPQRRLHMALGNAYHGDTIGSLSLGDGGFGTELYDELRFSVVRTPGYEDPGWLGKALAALEAHAGELAGAVMEPLVQGASGMLVADPADVGAFGEACRRAGVPLVADEVATGFGRTGRLFASEWCGLRPDVLCLGKGLTGGYLPMSATVVSDEIFSSFLGPDLGPTTLFHGHSFGGNALASAVALEHLRLFEAWDVLDTVRRRADQLAALLDRRIIGRPGVRAVRQRGLMAGVELEPAPGGASAGRRACAGAVARGVLLRPLGDIVVLMPPLTVTGAEIARIVTVLAAAIDDVVAGG